MMLLTQTPNKKAWNIIHNILLETVDLYADAYITKDNVRIGIRDNEDILLKCLKLGDKIVYDEEGLGLALVTGYSDKNFRKYIKVLTRSDQTADHLLKIIGFQIKHDLYAKLKKTSKFIKIFQRNNFKFVGDRGSEILLCRKYIPRKDFTYLILKEKGDLDTISIYEKRKK